MWKDKPTLNDLLNTPVQGTSADITKQALALLPTALEGTNAQIIATIHDEIIIEAPESKTQEVAKILEKVMLKAGKKFLLKVPVEVTVKVCDSWADK